MSDYNFLNHNENKVVLVHKILLLFKSHTDLKLRNEWYVDFVHIICAQKIEINRSRLSSVYFNYLSRIPGHAASWCQNNLATRRNIYLLFENSCFNHCSRRSYLEITITILRTRKEVQWLGRGALQCSRLAPLCLLLHSPTSIIGLSANTKRVATVATRSPLSRMAGRLEGNAGKEGGSISGEGGSVTLLSVASV
jgi:hypothetical protein